MFLRNLVSVITVPFLKCNAGCTKKMSVQDIRGISISPVLSKVLSIAYYAALVHFWPPPITSFGYKKILVVFMQFTFFTVVPLIYVP